MQTERFHHRHRRAVLFAAGIAVATTSSICAGPHAFAESDQTAADSADTKHPDVARKKRHRSAAKTQSKPAAPQQNDMPKADIVTAATQPAEGRTSGSVDFAAPFEKAGGSACKNQVNTLATSTMGSVEKFNTVANWSQIAGDRRAVSLAIGQKYAAGSAVPFSLSQVISTPNQQGSCDGFTVQVFPSPLSCAKLRDSIVAQKGQQIGDLAGIPLMQDAGGRTMLVPTASDTCVLVATRTFYAK